MDKKMFKGRDIPVVDLGDGVSRKVLAHSEGMMIVLVNFEKGAKGTPHTHPHEQVTYIESGKFRFTNGDDVCEVEAGDSLRFAPDIEHGTVCLEAGSVIDVFAPMRADFL